MKTRNKPKATPHEFHNNTTVPTGDVKNLVLLGVMVNNWRQRHVTIYQHPTEADRVITVGKHFDGKCSFICDEHKDAFKVALEYAARGKVYTFE